MPQYRNPQKRPVTITIQHDDAPRTAVSLDVQVHDPKSGEVAIQQVERRVPESVTILGGETQELPAYAKKQAVAAGLVLVEDKQPADKPKSNDAPKDAPRESADSPEVPNALKAKQKRGT